MYSGSRVSGFELYILGLLGVFGFGVSVFTQSLGRAGDLFKGFCG